MGSRYDGKPKWVPRQLQSTCMGLSVQSLWTKSNFSEFHCVLLPVHCCVQYFCVWTHKGIIEMQAIFIHTSMYLYNYVHVVCQYVSQVSLYIVILKFPFNSWLLSLLFGPGVAPLSPPGRLASFLQLNIQGRIHDITQLWSLLSSFNEEIAFKMYMPMMLSNALWLYKMSAK